MRGYRWIGNSARIVRIAHGETIFDQRFHINKQGYISGKDYSHDLPSGDVTRYIVFGNSFTAAEFLEVPWPDKIEEITNGSDNGKKYEFYSFAVDGGGLANWHETFFKEIVPNYEFDGIILACFVDNLYRKFTILHMDESGAYFGRFKSIPKDDFDFARHYFPKMKKVYDIMDDSEIDDRIKKYTEALFVAPPYNLYLLNKVIRLAGKISGSLKTDAKKQIGEEQFRRLQEILDWSRMHGKNVILASIPPKDGLTRKDKSWFKYEKDLEVIAKKQGISYFSGYIAFADFSVKDMESHWLRFDGHWNQRGSDRYAFYFTQYINQLSK